jgi:hypothetical protein
VTFQDKVWQKLAHMMELGPKERFSFEGKVTVVDFVEFF